MSSICIISHHCTAGRQYAPRPHAVAPTNHISSVEHCLLAAILPVITPSPSRIESKPAAAKSPDSHIHPPPFGRKCMVQGQISSSLSQGSVTVVMNLSVDSGYILHRAVKIYACKWEDSLFFQCMNDRILPPMGSGIRRRKGPSGNQEIPAGPLNGFG